MRARAAAARRGDGPAHALLLAGPEEDARDKPTLELARAFAGAAAATFAHQAAGIEHRRPADQHAALARAAKTLNESPASARS